MEEERKKIIEKYPKKEWSNGGNFPKYIEKQLSAHLRSSTNSNWDKYKEIYTRTHYSKNNKSQR